MNLIRLRPRAPTHYVSQGRTVLATASDGSVSPEPDQGLFVHETRVLSRFRVLINGEAPHPVALSNVEQHTWLGYYIFPAPGVLLGPPDPGSGQVPDAAQHTLEVRISRYVGEGLHQDVDVTNFTQHAISFRLEIELDADFADPVETSGPRQQQGRLERRWRTSSESAAWELDFHYTASHAWRHHGTAGTSHIDRGLRVQVTRPGSPPAYENGRIAFDISLSPHGAWHTCLNLIPRIEGVVLPLLYSCRSFRGTDNEYDRRRSIFLTEAAQFEAGPSESLTPIVLRALEQARRDLAALRLYDLDDHERSWTMAAGLPIYIALFGRDTLTTSWQAAVLGPEMMQGTLAELAQWQGKEFDDWRDEQPGRMLHEAHTGPLEALQVNPRARSYSSQTTSGFYPVVVAELWHWTGDEDLVRPFIGAARRSLEWLDNYGDLDRDGFYEYQTRSEQGVKHQAWKDSSDAIPYDDGSQVEPPIATCEEQGFVYAAKQLLSEVLWWSGEKDEARRLFREAEALKLRFNDAFWMEDAGFYAMGLDAEKRQIRSIGSNAGHCIATGIADAARVRRVADRLFDPDLFTGWGIRTLSSKHPAYNPYSYHRGSVWPVEHGTFALGFMRYGLHAHMERLCRAQFELAQYFEFCRLPEVFGGHQRNDDHPFPAFYPRANSPQAWSASTVFHLLQSLLGLYPYAPLRLLLVDPHLPVWLPELRLRNLRVGHAVATIRFFRTEDGSSDYRVEELRGPLHVIRQPSPWSLTATFGERLVDALTSLMPGR